jgi:hypothetical protein
LRCWSDLSDAEWGTRITIEIARKHPDRIGFAV